MAQPSNDDGALAPMLIDNHHSQQPPIEERVESQAAVVDEKHVIAHVVLQDQVTVPQESTTMSDSAVNDSASIVPVKAALYSTSDSWQFLNIPPPPPPLSLTIPTNDQIPTGLSEGNITDNVSGSTNHGRNDLQTLLERYIQNGRDTTTDNRNHDKNTGGVAIPQPIDEHEHKFVASVDGIIEDNEASTLTEGVVMADEEDNSETETEDPRNVPIEVRPSQPVIIRTSLVLD